MGNGANLLAPFLRKMEWDDEQITNWLHGRFQEALAADNPKKQNNPFFEANTPWSITWTAWGWQYLYFSHLFTKPQRDEIFQHIMDDARQSPEDVKKMTLFLTSFQSDFTSGLKPKAEIKAREALDDAKPEYWMEPLHRGVVWAQGGGRKLRHRRKQRPVPHRRCGHDQPLFPMHH